MPNRAARRTQPASPAPAPAPTAAQQQVDIGRVLTRYRENLAEATQQAIIAQAGQDQALEENSALRARIAELESQAVSDAQDADEAQTD